MASARPVDQSDKRLQVNTNPHNDKSPIRVADGTEIIKYTCKECNVRYGYNKLLGNTVCPKCGAKVK